jgi:hypothetical protein
VKKKIIQLATLFLLAIAAGFASAQDTGSPLNLGLPDLHAPGWNTIINNNSIAINNFAATVNTGTAINTLISRLPNCNIAGGYFYSPFLGQCAIPAGGGGGGAVSSVFTRTGDVIAQTGDYNFSQISGIAAPSQLPVGAAGSAGILKCGTNTVCTAGVISVPVGNVGTVTSFSAGDLNPLFTSSVSLATSTPALTFSPTPAGQNLVFAGPTSGGAGAYTFRALVANDIPTSTLTPATTSTYGVAKCDGTTITCTSGVFSAVGGGGGTVVPSPQFQIPFYSSAGTSSSITGDTFITTDGSGNVTVKSVATTGAAGVGGGTTNTEGTATAGASGQDIWWADSASHWLKMNNNNAGADFIAGIGTAGTAGNCVKFGTGGLILADSGGPCSGGAAVQLTSSSSQTVTQSVNTYLFVNYMNRRIYVDGFPSTCSGGTTQADCAWIAAVNLANSTSNTVDLVFGAQNSYLKNNQWVEPTGGFWSVNLIGAGRNATFIQDLTSAPTTASILRGAGAPSAYLVIRDLTINAGGNRGSCFDLLGGGSSGGEIRNVTCEGFVSTAVSGIDHAAELGSTGSNFYEDWNIENFGISAPFGVSQTYGNFTAVLTGTALTSVTITSGGTYGSVSAAATYGVAHVNDPHGFCSGNEPTLVPLFGGTTAVTGFTITNAGTCTAPPDISVILETPVTYGLKAYVSDSSIDHYSGTGQTSIILFGASDFVTHFHPIAVWNGIEASGAINLAGTECDTVINCIILDSTASGSTLSQTNAVTAVGGKHLPGSVLITMKSSALAANFSTFGLLCGGGASPDYQEFVTTGTGPTPPGGTGWPALVGVSANDHSCTSMGTGMNTDFTPSIGVGAMKYYGVAASTPLLGTDANNNVVPGSVSTAVARWATGYCTGAASTSVTGGFINFGGNVGCATAPSTTIGFQLPSAGGAITNISLVCMVTGTTSTDGTVQLFYTAPGSTTRTSLGLTLSYGTTTAGTSVAPTGFTSFSYAANGTITANMAPVASAGLASCSIGFNY